MSKMFSSHYSTKSLVTKGARIMRDLETTGSAFVKEILRLLFFFSNSTFFADIVF